MRNGPLSSYRPDEQWHKEQWHARSGSALPTDELAAYFLGKLASVMDQEAARAGELVGLPRDNSYGQLFAR
jgi:hypothetical protein